MTVTLPDTMKDWLETQAQIAGHGRPDDYVEQVLLQEQGRIRQEIESQLIEGIESGPATQVDDAFWTERRRVLAERMGQTA